MDNGQNRRPPPQQDADMSKEITPETVADSGAPAIASPDWDAVASGEIVVESIPENGDLRYEDLQAQHPEEDDDNPYQESDEALPDDRDEASMARDRTGGRFGEV